ncbi:hypothetical protein B0H66DRAFT_317411 [Apodospora peruviana]|uniref:Uncharacterized protein n=1 Tax=Apodospora peruviana TaxID=516989 RepID=A0AAE0HXC3_9PEZI|nr:hypothetical protein B0H66DRAFT_317411 [Apodospora peruviana]
MSPSPPNDVDDVDDRQDAGAEVNAVEHDFDDDDLDADAAAMAAAMGFSSFGMQESNRPSKKRRYNDGQTDGFDAGTGANSLPLHPRASASTSQSAVSAKEIADEIDLDGDDEQITNTGGAQVIDDAAPPGTTSYTSTLPPPPGVHDPSSHNSGGGGRGGRSARGGRGGGHSVNRQWYLDYYDPSFNENPWERLEQAKGLAPVGSWLVSNRSSGAGAKSLATAAATATATSS